jgi:hypothetical protein
MKRWLHILIAVFVLAMDSANAQTGKAGPMAKLPHSLIALHQQHTASPGTTCRGAIQLQGPFGEAD